MLSKIIGGALLIIGTSIGAGMLALPVATAAGGFYNSVWLFFGAWLSTVFAAFLILEVNLWLPEETNLVSMAKATLGSTGQIITWACYLLLLYSLLSAYTAGGADVLHALFLALGFESSQTIDSLLFAGLLGLIVHYGIHAVDMANRGFMAIKLSSYLILVSLIIPHINFPKLAVGHYRNLYEAIMVVITSFGYATIIPSLRSYFKSNVKALRITIACGSLASLLCYLLWDFAVQGTINTLGANGLINMASSGRAASQLTLALSNELNKHVSNIANIFTSICLTTSFLGVGLCLSDFLSDGLHILKKNGGKLIITLLTFLPPLAIVLFYPGAFIIGLKYAGIFCVILLILLPALMAWSGRYIKKIANGYEVIGGRWLLIAEIIIAAFLLYYGILHLD